MSSYVEKSVVSKKSSEESIKTRNEGNKLYCSRNHNKEIHLKILSLYNQSAAYAENDSEELALAISNRSVLLMHFKMYKESIDDIEKSLQVTKSEELKTKLLTRKIKCLSLMDQVDKKLNDTQEYQAPTIHKVSKTIPCAADCVSIIYNKDYGRCVVATEDIKPGTIIVKEKSVVLFPFMANTYTNCSHCLLLASNGVPCNSCVAVIYCSERCKEEAWLQYHDLECLILPHLEFKYSDATNLDFDRLKLTFRLFIKFIKKEGFENVLLKINEMQKNNFRDGFIKGFFENGLFQSDKFQSFYNLTHNAHDILIRNGFYLKPIIRRFVQILMEKTSFLNDYNKIFNIQEKAFLCFIEQVVYEMKLIVDLNAFSFYDKWELSGEEKWIGISILIFTSLFNHSCNHYTSQGFTNNQESFIYALKFIRKGEQIFVNYDPSSEEKTVRQNNMKYRYNFICQCEPCTDNWPAVNIDNNLKKFRNNSDIIELILEFGRNNISKFATFIFFGDPINEDSFDETIVNDIIKIFEIIEKKFTGFQAFVYFANVQYYIESYFFKFRVRILNIPDTC